VIDFGTFLCGWEPTTIDFLTKSLDHGDIAIEVGAIVGAHTLLMAKLTGDDGNIYAFEPTDFALNKLRKNILLNPKIKT
jgi:precorrin-6B methylase 2